MSIANRLVEFLGSLGSQQLALALGAASALLLVIEDRRVCLLPLLVQYLLLAPLVGSQVYRPVLFTRIGLGIAVCLILYVTAAHVQRRLDLLAPQLSNQNSVSRTPAAPAMRAMCVAGMGLAFRLMVVALGGLVAYGVWRAYPLAAIPSATNLSGYWLVSMGLLVALTSVDPLRTGLGVLTVVNGFEGIYLHLEQSLVIIGLLGMLNILLALGVATCSESWLESLQWEASG